MRTTIDLPTEIHDLARELAHQQNKSMSTVVTELIRAGLDSSTYRPAPQHASRAMPTISVGRTVSADDVRSLEDEL